LLAGARRGARALPPARARPVADHGSAGGYVGRPERAQGARSRRRSNAQGWRRRAGGLRRPPRGPGPAHDASRGQSARSRAAAGGEDARLLRGDQTQRLGRGRGVGGIGLLGEPREAVIRNHPSQPSLRQPFGADMSVVTLAQASTIVDAALNKGRDTNCAPLTVAVLDSGGHLVAFKREDKSGLLRFDIAFGKAWGALGMGFGSRTLAARAAKTPQFFTMLAAASGGRMVTNPGGVLIRTAAGDIIGAVGISGDTSDRDEACAIAGIEAAGLKADPGQDAS